MELGLPLTGAYMVTEAASHTTGTRVTKKLCKYNYLQYNVVDVSIDLKRKHTVGNHGTVRVFNPRTIK